MPGEDTPAQHKSSKTATDVDVQRLLNFALAAQHNQHSNWHRRGPGRFWWAGAGIEGIYVID